MAKYNSINDIPDITVRSWLKAAANVFYDGNLQAALDDMNKSADKLKQMPPVPITDQALVQLRASHANNPSPSQGK